MCRLILAVGCLSADEILDAAVAMSSGQTADHDGAITVHPNGWGAVWSQEGAPHGLAVHRDVRPLAESFADSPLRGVAPRFLAIHARHATLPKNTGLRFTHPLARDGEVPWYFLHNGFLPSVHRLVGLPASEFDSREYFDYIVPKGAERLDEAATLERLRAIPAADSSGNAIALNPDRAYVIHWTAPLSRTPRYFAMYRLRTPHSLVIASEAIPSLAPRGHWEPLEADRVIEVPLGLETG